MSSTSTVLSNIFILTCRSFSCVLAGDDIAVERFCPGSRVLTPEFFWTPKREPGVCRTLYVPSISPIFQQWAEPKQKVEENRELQPEHQYSHMKIPLMQNHKHSPYWMLFTPLSKPVIDLMKCWSKIQLLGRKLCSEKKKNSSKAWLENSIFQPVPSCLLSHWHFNFRLIFVSIQLAVPSRHKWHKHCCQHRRRHQEQPARGLTPGSSFSGT